MSSKRSFSRTFLCGVAFGALTLSGAAWAQDATTETTEDEAVEVVTEKPAEDEARQEKITVTGSLLRRDEFTSASPIQVITADTASLQGLVDSASILQGSSLASGSTQINNQFAGYVVDGGTGVNTVDLRGCGTTRTLVLINGKRPGPSGTRGAVGDGALQGVELVQRGDQLLALCGGLSQRHRELTQQEGRHEKSRHAAMRGAQPDRSQHRAIPVRSAMAGSWRSGLLQAANNRNSRMPGLMA